MTLCAWNHYIIFTSCQSNSNDNLVVLEGFEDLRQPHHFLLDLHSLDYYTHHNQVLGLHVYSTSEPSIISHGIVIPIIIRNLS